MWLCLTARIRLLQREFIRFKDFLVSAPGCPALKFRLEVSLGLQATGSLCFTHVTHLTPDNRSPEAVTGVSGRGHKKQTNKTNQHKTS